MCKRLVEIFFRFSDGLAPWEFVAGMSKCRNICYRPLMYIESGECFASYRYLE